VLQFRRALLDAPLELVVCTLQFLFRLVLLGRVTSDFGETAQRTSFLVI